jgi:CheY-like chemotaxis protein
MTEKTERIHKVFLIDDDAMSNLINQRLLRKYDWEAEVVIFKDGTTALDALREAALTGVAWPEVILLDMEMPVFDGWAFLAAYGELPESLTSRCLLYLLSSSINPHDVKKAQTFPHVEAYLTKPLTHASLNRIGQDYLRIV